MLWNKGFPFQYSKFFTEQLNKPPFLLKKSFSQYHLNASESRKRKYIEKYETLFIVQHKPLQFQTRYVLENSSEKTLLFCHCPTLHKFCAHLVKTHTQKIIFLANPLHKADCSTLRLGSQKNKQLLSSYSQSYRDHRWSH